MTAEWNHEFVQWIEVKFAQVDEAFAEQRQFIEFLYNKLDKRIAGLEQRFDRLEQRFDGLEQRFGRLEQRIDGLEQRIGGLEQRFDRLEHRIDRLDRTVLQFIDVQIKTNELVERRLLLLERANPMRPM